jgi:hypothetical protein
MGKPPQKKMKRLTTKEDKRWNVFIGVLYNKLHVPPWYHCIVQFSLDLCSKPPPIPETPTTPHNANSQAWPRLCNWLILFPKTAYRSAECIYHPIVHYIMVSECAREDCPIFDREENASKLSSQLFQFLELWCKFRDNILKSPHTDLLSLTITTTLIPPCEHNLPTHPPRLRIVPLPATRM